MFSIDKCPLPDNALLQSYRQNNDYTDCYTTDIRNVVTLAEYVSAFYTTCLFKLERLILKIAVSRPSTDAEARQLASGEVDTFAAWYVESRSENQILMCDFRNRTRSWLMVSPLPGDDGGESRLYFGSAVVRAHDNETTSPGTGFNVLLQIHKLYSVALLYSAKSRLQSQHR